ncbi:hypothetical protein pb186bvf_012622 [Paramecium bursaria]
MIRFGRSPQPSSTRAAKKPDNLDILTIIDNCTQIFKDDRIILRNMVKDGNLQLIALLQNYKKGSVTKELQTELRKFIRKKDYKENIQEKLSTCHSPNQRQTKTIHEKDFGNGSQKKQSCPDLWKGNDNPTPRKINLVGSKKNDIQPINEEIQYSEVVVLTERDQENQQQTQELVSQVFEFQTEPQIEQIHTYRLETQEEPTPQQSQSISHQTSQQQFVSEQFVTNQAQDISNLDSDTSQESEFDSPKQKDIIKNQEPYFRLDNRLKTEEAVSVISVRKEVQPTPDISNARVYTFNFTDCQAYASNQYKVLFTHWPSLLMKLENKEVIPIQKQQILIHASPEYIFNILFPSSTLVKINYFRFKELLQSHLNVDLDLLFREFDQDFDDWINYRDTGLILDGFCTFQETPRNCVRVIFETLKTNMKLPSTLSYEEVNDYLQSKDQCFAKELFQEVDVFNKGYLTYWDLYIHRDIYLMEKLCEIVSST